LGLETRKDIEASQHAVREQWNHLLDENGLKSQEHRDLVNWCFIIRHAGLLQFLSEKIKAGEQAGFGSMREALNEACRGLRHYLGRLGEHAKAIGVFIKAAQRLPHLLQNYRVRTCPAEEQENIPLLEKKMTIDSIVGRLTSDEYRIHQLRELLHRFDGFSNLSARLEDSCKQKTRVHAELYLARLAIDLDFTFVDNDPYIGCSKPACYSCFKYLQAMKSRLVMPPTSNNLYLIWRPPKPFVSNQNASSKQQDEALKKSESAIIQMGELVRKDVFTHVNERLDTGRRQAHPDSTTGISESVISMMERHNL
jgi:OTT_1508-like deaminase